MSIISERNRTASKTDGLKAQVAQYWDDRAKTFALQREQELCGSSRLRWEEELARQLGDATGLRVLDVGCGCGFFAMILAAQGQQVTGIDLSAEMVARGRVLSRKYRVPVQLLQMDAERPHFAPESFDVVVSRNLTWTLPHPAQAYERWLRLLKPGGLLLNYDAEHAKYHQRIGLDHEPAHRMLSQAQKDECMRLYDALPASGWDRPAWDRAFLAERGCLVTVDARAGERLFHGYPIFRIRAVKR